MQLFDALNALKTLPWFPESVREVRAFRLENNSEFTSFMKRGTPQQFRNPDGSMKYPWLDQDQEIIRTFRTLDEDRRKILYYDHNIDFEFAVLRHR